MKNIYLSSYDFEKNCPCAYLLNEYVMTLISDGETFLLKEGRKLDSKKYAATYDILSPKGSYTLKAVCDMSDEGNYHYSFRKMNGL